MADGDTFSNCGSTPRASLGVTGRNMVSTIETGHYPLLRPLRPSARSTIWSQFALFC